MRFRFFVGFLLAVPVLAACGSSSSSGTASSAKDQAAAIASAEAGGAKQSAAPSTAVSSAPSASSASASASDSGSDTCPDQTVNGLKISNVMLTDGGTCAEVSKVAASSQLATTLTGSSSDFSVDGFTCDVELVSLVACEMDSGQAKINFNADK